MKKIYLIIIALFLSACEEPKPPTAEELKIWKQTEDFRIKEQKASNKIKIAVWLEKDPEMYKRCKCFGLSNTDNVICLDKIGCDGVIIDNREKTDAGK